MLPNEPAIAPENLAAWRTVDTGFPVVAAIFDDCLRTARQQLSPGGLNDHLEAARQLGKLGRGAEPLLAFLEHWPGVAVAVGEACLPPLLATIHGLQRSPNGKAIAPLLNSLHPVARRLHSAEAFTHYLRLVQDLAQRTTGSIHGHQATFPSAGLPEFLGQAPKLVTLLALDGLARWIDYGIKNHPKHPEHQRDYFSLQSADSRAILQRERQGTLLADVERSLGLYLRGLWQDDAPLIGYSTAFDELRQPVPYRDDLGIRLPDVYTDQHGVAALDRYRAILAHLAGHRRYSTAQIADNWSPFQRMAVEFFEDARIDSLLIRQYPGLRRILCRLHPRPEETACDPETTSCLRHRLTLLSYALLDPAHGYDSPIVQQFSAEFTAEMAKGESCTEAMAALALRYVAQTRRPSDQFSRVHFADTVIEYRDDNRHLWRFIEAGDEEETFEERAASDPQELTGLPPRYYREWDYLSQSYRPDWACVYEALHPAASADRIDQLLAKHAGTAKQLKKLLDLLKPQDKVRIRYQEEGSELDLDIAIRSLIDFKSGSPPDPRINMSHQTNGRSIAVLLLLDLSASLNERAPHSDQTILQLSQEAVSLLAWAIDQLGDPLAIAGFHSNTRFEVRYQHIKGFREPWGDSVKARLAAMQANYSTRMGAAMRHAAHYLAAQPADKKLMLILTDGEPADVDVADSQALIEDTRQAVIELDQQGIYSYGISLDARLAAQQDDYIRQIFGQNYTVIDQINRLPEQLPKLFISLTR
ncbi:nitric oxide reductase activation protein NorD [Halothiobacillus sp. DCM-1]|uniref:nitric oxide reductase activation protein NorD n=1 Tax=Halothiobacillus sp. DCM-1 TaxID=3112558 RepID=UPI003244852D